MAEFFPATIDQEVERGTWRQAPISNVIQSQSEFGPPKRRARFTKQLHKVSGSMVMTVDQFETFETWFKTTLGFGVKTFLFRHPHRGVDQIYSFDADSPYSDVPFGHNVVRVTFNWREELL